LRGVGDQGIGTPDLIDDLRGASDKPLMRSLKIAQTIYLLLGAALAAGCGASSYLMVRCAGISARYTAIMQGEVTQAQQIRVLQVTYKKQVQAWKDILLRGKDDTALAKYDLEFHALAAQVEGECAEMDGRIKDPEARTGLKNFREQQEVLDSQYESALAKYRVSRDFSAADGAVKGKDRPPTDSLDKVVNRLTSLSESVPAEEAVRLRHEQNVLIGVLALLWLALGALSVRFARSLGTRMELGVGFVRRIAEGDLTADAPEEGRVDELGVLIKAMTDMRGQLRDMVAGIQSATDTLGFEASSVSSASTEIAAAAKEQRGQSQQVAAALEEMIASAREVTHHCHEATGRAVETGKLAAESGHSVEAVVGEVRELAAEARRNAENVEKLGASSRQIGQVVTLIQEIAGQTNLLALNAAIESARAGEHGRGFAVVAGEVRRLAERTTAATKEISDAVEAIQQGTREAVESIQQSSVRTEKSVATADAASRSLGVLSNSTTEVRERIAQIAQASEEQTQASGLVGESMNQIASGITSSSEGAEESARTAAELVKLSQTLAEHSRQFKTGEEQAKPQLVGKRRAA
jgi:methyl-accepting chemotaxis protein